MQTAQRKTAYQVPAARPKKRVVKMDGNVAYINNGFAKHKVKQRSEAIKKHRKMARRGLWSTLFVLFIAFGTMAVLVSRYAVVCSIGSENNNMAQDIAAIETKIEALSLDLELKDDLEYVQNIARNELGMTYPNKDQKIYIDLSG